MALSAEMYAQNNMPLGCDRIKCNSSALGSDIEAEKQRWVSSCVEAVKRSDPLFINRNKQALTCAAKFEEFVFPLRGDVMDKNVQNQKKLENTGFDNTTLIIIIAAVAVAIYIYKS